MTENIENHTLELLKAIRTDMTELKTGQGITNLRLASIEDKLSGESLYHLALRDEFLALKERVERIEAAQGLAQ